MVCHVNEQGELKCGPSVTPLAIDAAVKSAVQAALPGLTPAKIQLMLELLDVVYSATLDDACIDVRRSDITGSVQQLLTSDTPIILTYQYKALPGNMLTAYYVQQGKYDWARATLDEFATANLKPGCP